MKAVTFVRLTASAAWLSVLLSSVVCLAQKPAETSNSRPAKLDIISPTRRLQVGQSVDLELVLQDANNRPAKARKDLSIELEAVSPSGKTQKLQVPIKAGTESAKVQLPLSEAGFVKVQAKEREMQAGGTLLLVKPQAPPQQQQQPQPQKKAPMRRQKKTSLFEPGEPFGPPDSAWMRGFAAKPWTPSSLGLLAQGPAVAAAGAPSYLVTLTTYVPKKPKADGTDYAKIQAFVLGAECPKPIEVQLASDIGALDPNPLVIRALETKGESTLTSQKTGPVSVRYIRAAPPVDLQGDRELKVNFYAPIGDFDPKPSPPSISLLDQSKLVVRLLDEHGTQTDTDEPRQITLTLQTGKADFAPPDVTIAAGQSVGNAVLRPFSSGTIAVVASTPNLHDRSFTVQVTWPTLLLILAGVGGLAGGWVAFWEHPTTRWLRIPIGALTGFFFYWGVALGLLPYLPRSLALNPISAFAVALAGGYAGPSVIGLLLRKWGAGPPPAPAPQPQH
ncbi:MAG TPA: hypothetical protein VEU62_20005 [Bryobacterales bacterium]|nr:hypothetical protein [Bryobacterales bacterium]